MISLEDEIFTEIATALRDKYENISVYGEEPGIVPSFPCVTIEENDNYVYSRTQDSGSMENHAVLVYPVNVYSNRTSGRKAECKEIMSFIDNMMAEMGFTRMTAKPYNINDSTMFRMIARYQAVVDKNNKVYRR